MATLIDQLLELQQQHIQLRDLHEKSRGARVALTATERQIAQQQAIVDKLQKERKKAQVDADARELEIKTVQGKIDKYHAQLNEVKTNKEYKAIQNEIQFANIELRRVEDLELTTMEKLEKMSGEMQKAQDAMKAIERERDEIKQHVGAATESLTADIQKAERDRRLIAEQIPADALAVFDRVATRHEDGAMAPVLRDDQREGSYTCGGCYMQLTQNDYVKLLGDRNVLITCPSCSRILYVEPE